MRGLALEGGGAKGAYQAGVIKAFNKRGIKFDGVAGTSIGAINAAFYASGNFDLMYKLWSTADSKKLFGYDTKTLDALKNGTISKDLLIKGLDSINKIIKNGGIDTNTIRKILKENVKEERLRKSPIDYGLVTFNISDFKPVEITKKDIPEGKLVDYIMASAYLPFFKFEKIIDNKFYLDGGIYANCPVDLFIKNGYKEIYAVKAWEGSKVKYTHKNGVKVIVIGSKEKLGSIMDFSPKTVKRKMNLGYYDTLKALDKLDGKKYYLKRYNEKYYSDLFDEKDIKAIIKKYKKTLIISNNKAFIIDILESICDELKIKQFTIHNIPVLITKLKYLMLANRKSVYYDFIDKIKIKF